MFVCSGKKVPTEFPGVILVIYCSFTLRNFKKICKGVLADKGGKLLFSNVSTFINDLSDRISTGASKWLLFREYQESRLGRQRNDKYSLNMMKITQH